jgi:hypothetical protein
MKMTLLPDGDLHAMQCETRRELTAPGLEPSAEPQRASHCNGLNARLT